MKGLNNIKSGVFLTQKGHFAGSILIRKGLVQAKKEALGLEVDQKILDQLKKAYKSLR